ncbi:MAG: acyltransferase [Microthrixaceae bacterium]
MVQTAEVGRPTKFPYVAALDGLRGIFVLVIGLFHFSITAGWGLETPIFPGSFFAPSAFFTLSGYLITSLLLVERERSGTIDGPGFWGRRFRRLLPASVAVIVVAAILTAFSMELWGPFPGVDAAGGLFSMSNWQAIRLAEADNVGLRALGPLGVFWSLGLEEQFYLGLFVVVMVTSRLVNRMRWLTWTLIAVAALSVTTQVLMDASLAREYFGTDTRAAEAVAGCLFAIWVHNRGLPRSDLGLGRGRRHGAGVRPVDLRARGRPVGPQRRPLGVLVGDHRNDHRRERRRTHAEDPRVRPARGAGPDQLPRLPHALADRSDHEPRQDGHGRLAPHHRAVHRHRGCVPGRSTSTSKVRCAPSRVPAGPADWSCGPCPRSSPSC